MRADYIDKVKDELIKSGKLGKDNFIDEQKKLAAAGRRKYSHRCKMTLQQESR